MPETRRIILLLSRTRECRKGIVIEFDEICVYALSLGATNFQFKYVPIVKPTAIKYQLTRLNIQRRANPKVTNRTYLKHLRKVPQHPIITVAHPTYNRLKCLF